MQDLITKSLHEDLFVVRNVANIVPPFRDSEEYFATTSAIEYAVKVLKVKNIVVCGHSNCGGCKALSLPEKELAEIPHTKKWLELAKRAKKMVEENAEENISEGELESMVEEENVIEQMNHLLSYPFIAEKFEKGEIQIYGWYYDISSGKVFNYNREKNIRRKSKNKRLRGNFSR